MKWEEAEELWSTVRTPSNGKPLGNNTRLWWSEDYYVGWVGLSLEFFQNQQDSDCFIITLHGNVIIKIYEDDSQVLDSCYWKTVTTKDRINKWGLTETYFDPEYGVTRRRFYLYQKDFQWYIQDKKLGTIEMFYDGLIIYPDETETANNLGLFTLNFPEGVI